jgi:hypothetical protein
MKTLAAIFVLCVLTAGCSGVRRSEVVGVYMIRVDTASGTLDLKNDGTYVQTVAIAGTAAGARNGKWEMGKSGDYTLVTLEKAFAVEKCPQCALAPKENLILYLTAGEMNIFLAQDSEQSRIVYSK